MKSNFSTFCQLIWHTKGGFRVNLTSCASFSSGNAWNFLFLFRCHQSFILILGITFQRSIRVLQELQSRYRLRIYDYYDDGSWIDEDSDNDHGQEKVGSVDLNYMEWNCTLSDIFVISSTLWRSALSQVVNTRDPRFCITFRMPGRVVKPVSYRFSWTESTWRSI